MTDRDETGARNSFLFGEPGEFFEAFAGLALPNAELNVAMSVFRANLLSALQVGNIPFQLAHVGVLDQRYNQLVIAETIRCRTKVERGEIAEEQIDSVARQIADIRMREELADKEFIERHADHTLQVLDRHFHDGGFRASSQELLRQVVVICWGAFEILANDTLRVLLNSKPKIITLLAESKPYRDLLSARTLMDALEANDFNLSSMMGDVFCEVVRLDSLERIRDAVRIALADPPIDITLKDERLWKIFQQRHLIVHRRGLIDARYLERTADNARVGESLSLTGDYVESALAFVRDVGCGLLRSASAKVSL